MPIYAAEVARLPRTRGNDVDESFVAFVGCSIYCCVYIYIVGIVASTWNSVTCIRSSSRVIQPLLVLLDTRVRIYAPESARTLGGTFYDHFTRVEYFNSLLHYITLH